MNPDRSFDDRLAARVRSLGLEGAASTLIEALAPLAWVGAQLGYMVGPLIGADASRGAGLVGMLEDPQRMAGLVENLRREPPP
jgi:hypothetical protein